MRTLRNELATIIFDAVDERHHMTLNGDYGQVDEGPYIDRILALVHDALTSDEAVVAGVNAYMDDPFDEDVLSGWVAGIHASMDAAGITKGADHE